MKNDNNMTARKKSKPWLVMVMVGIVCACVNNLNAGSDNVNLGANTTINARCAFIGSSALVAFGVYDPIVIHAVLPALASDSFLVLCTKNTSSQISMGTGLYAAFASGTTRAMSNGSGGYLSYEIYTTAALSLVWNLSNTVSYTNLGGGAATITVFGKIPPAQSVPAGNYSDTVVTTINY